MSGSDNTSYTVRTDSTGGAIHTPWRDTDSVIIYNSNGFAFLDLPKASTVPGRVVTARPIGSGSYIFFPFAGDSVNGNANLDVMSGGVAAIVSDGVNSWFTLYSRNTQVDP